MRKLANLLAIRKEKFIGIDAIGDSTADDWKQVKYYGRLLGIAEEQLMQDVEDNDKGEEGGDRSGDNKDERRLYDKIAQRAGSCS